MIYIKALMGTSVQRQTVRKAMNIEWQVLLGERALTTSKYLDFETNFYN